MFKPILTMAIIGLLCGLAIFSAAPARAQDEEQDQPYQPAQEDTINPAEQQQWQRENACVLTGACTCLAGVCTMNATGARFAAPPVPKPDVWGAIAVSPSTLVFGKSWNWNSRKEAAAAALKYCGARDCKVIATVADVCVSLVESVAQRIYVVGGPIGAANFADNNGMLKCRREGGRACRVEASFCADGIKHVLKGHTVFTNGNPIFVPKGQGAPFGRTFGPNR